MTEAQFQTKFSRWLQYRFNENIIYELKVAKNGRFYLRNIRDHQLTFLHAAKNGKAKYKIPDIGNTIKPVDGFMFCQEKNSFLIVFFEEVGRFYFIDINVLYGFISTGAKSIDQETADFLGIHHTFT